MSFKNNYKLGIYNEIFTTISNIKKNIYKIVFTRKHIRENNMLNNYLHFVYFYNILTRLLKKLISIVNISFVFKAVISYFLDILLSNSDFITVSDCIYLLLLLNQLEHLIIKSILNYTIKNKKKIYLDLD